MYIDSKSKITKTAAKAIATILSKGKRIEFNEKPRVDEVGEGVGLEAGLGVSEEDGGGLGEAVGAWLEVGEVVGVGEGDGVGVGVGDGDVGLGVWVGTGELDTEIVSSGCASVKV